MVKHEAKMATCVITGEHISNIGPIRNCIEGDHNENGAVDGCFTQVGALSARFIPVYEYLQVDLVDRVDLSPKEVRNEILGRLRNISDSDEILREETREMVLDCVEQVDILDSKMLVRKLKALMLRGINVNKYADGEQDDSVGLPLKVALHCMEQDIRTVKFVDSLLRAIEKLDHKDRIVVVDAGCGPLPVFAILAALKSDKIDVVGLEYNQDSIDMANDVLENLGLSDRVEIKKADCREYQHDEEIDLLISETMYAGLVSEDIVQIMNNLAEQMSDDGLVLPRKLTVEAGIAEYNAFGMAGNGIHGEVVVPVRTVCEYIPGDGLNQIYFELPLNTLEVDCEYRLVLGSTVELDDVNVLTGDDSNITKPQGFGGPFHFSSKTGGSKFDLNVSYSPGARDGDLELCIVGW